MYLLIPLPLSADPKWLHIRIEMINTGALRGLAMSIGIAVLVSRVDLQFDAVLPGNNIRLILSFMVYFGISTIVYRFFTAKNNLVWRLALAWVFTVVAFVGSCLHPVNSEMPIRRIADVLDSKACRDWIDIAEAQAVIRRAGQLYCVFCTAFCSDPYRD